MKHIAVILFLMICCDYVAAQESHYHRSLRSQDTEYGLTQEPHFNGSGMLWSRTRNVDDVAITQETYEDSIARVRAFTQLFLFFIVIFSFVKFSSTDAAFAP